MDVSLQIVAELLSNNKALEFIRTIGQTEIATRIGKKWCVGVAETILSTVSSCQTSKSIMCSASFSVDSCISG